MKDGWKDGRTVRRKKIGPYERRTKKDFMKDGRGEGREDETYLPIPTVAFASALYANRGGEGRMEGRKEGEREEGRK